jgi:hypothetical protein
VARRVGLRDITIVLLAVVVICLLLREAYQRGAEDGYWEAIETDYACEVYEA